MATIKVDKKNYSYMYKITATSADNVFIPYENALKKTTSIDFDLSNSDQDMFAKSGNDLIILSIFNEQRKAVTNTIKDYFKYAPKYAFVVITQTGNYLDIIDNNTTSYYDYITKNLTTQNTINGVVYDVSDTDPEYFAGGAKSDSYYIVHNKLEYGNFNGGNDYIYDVAGNDNYIIRAGQASREHFAEIHDFQGNDNYSFGNDTYAKVYDNKGNDKYASRLSKVEITDLTGKDNYSLTNNTAYNIIDDAGDDKYLIYDSGDNTSSITDNKGNDKYELIRANYGTITDESGNDTYKLELASNIEIIEESGKEKYTITASDNINVEDSLGKDKYAITASSDIVLKDYEGKDSYIVTSTKNINITDGKENETKSGNDTYNLSYISAKEVSNVQTYNTIDDYAGAEKYNLSYCDYFKINDYNGNDKYILSNSTQSNITDKKGSDSYTLKDTSSTITDNGEAEYIGKKLNKKLANDKYTAVNSTVDVTDKSGDDVYKFISSTVSNLTDKSGNDKYTLENSYAVITDTNSSNDTYNITNTMATITDDGGKDSYNLNSYSTADIYDNGKSNKDSYTIKGMNGMVTIADDGGSGDTLKITDVNKNNLIFMLDFISNASKYPSAVNSGDLFIFDKTTAGCTVIKDYFKLESSYIQYTDATTGAKAVTSDGCLEKIYAGKKDVTNEMFSKLAYGKTDALSNTIASWLSDTSHSYGSVSAVLTSGTHDAADFIAYFTNN